jgi:molybdate transport system substrate-binding protein
MSGPDAPRGGAEIGFQQMSELIAVKGITYLGPLPDDIQLITVFSGAVHSQAKNPAGAAALLKFLTSPDAVRAIRKAGMEAEAVSSKRNSPGECRAKFEVRFWPWLGLRFASSPLACLASFRLDVRSRDHLGSQLLSFVDKDQKLRAISVSQGIARRSTA